MLARGALISALVSIFLMPAILCVCEPVFNKTSWRWKTPDPVPALPASEVETLPAPEEERLSAASTEEVPAEVVSIEAEPVSAHAE